MKRLIPLFFVLLSFTTISAQPGKVNTTGDNSPAVIAKNFSATYGVRADAIEAILWIYEAKGYDAERRKRVTEKIVREYVQSPEREQKADELTEASRINMGIADAPEIANALAWDLFARSHYLSTTGYNSPAVLAQGDVNIWYGIPPKALRALAAHLEKNITDLNNFETKLADQVKKYEELRKSLVNREDEMATEAKQLLEEGEIDEAVKVLGDRRYALKKQRERAVKREAEAAFDYAEGLMLQLKYDSAAVEFLAAVDLDPENSTYHLYYANNKNTLAHYDEAIKHYEIALGIDSLKSGNEEFIATLINNLGLAWKAKGEYDKAIDNYEIALQIYLKVLDENHTNIATQYNNLGLAWYSKGAYDKAIDYFEKALQILSKVLGEYHPSVAMVYNNLGKTWDLKGAYDKAIDYSEKALQIYLKALGENHPSVAMVYNNLGEPWYSKGAYDKAIDYFEKCQTILGRFFEPTHLYQKKTARNLSEAANSRGMELSNEKKYEEALRYFQKALQNAQMAGDDVLLLICLINTGSTQKYLKRYEEGLQSLDTGLQKAAQGNRELDRTDKEQLTPQILGNPEVQATFRQMQYHKVGCLKGLKRKKEAKALAEQLWQEGIEANDTRLLEDLRKDGYDFGR